MRGSLNLPWRATDAGVISVQAALYGRADKETCSEGRHPSQLGNTECSLDGTVDLVRQSCNGKNSCTIRVGNTMFGDPCRGTYKYCADTAGFKQCLQICSR
uniref:SUEL-type lectin domain-containing protein n=1 Tax=Mola mola TaxID=94237 RepID=A0A3Q3X9X0_MOLML